MKSKRRSLVLEQLEARYCPSLSVMYRSGTLTVSGSPTGPVVVTQVAPNALNVTDNGTSLGTYNVTGDLVFNLRDHSEKSVNLDMGGFTFSGNVSMSLGLGDPLNNFNQVPDNGIGIFNGTINGSISVRGGGGSEVLILGSSAAAVAVSGDLDVGGNVFMSSKIAPGLFGDTLAIGAVDLTVPPPFPSLSTVNIGGQLITQGVNGIAINALSTVASNATLSASGDNFKRSVEVVGAVNGNLSILSNTNSIEPQFIAVDDPFNFLGSAGTVGGNLTVTLGGGLDLFLLGPGAVVNGNALITDLNGDESYFLSGQVLGSMTLNMGNGNHFVDTSFGALVVDGNLTIFGGNGADDLNGGAGSLLTNVSGSLTVNLGGGTNSLTFDAVAGSSVGGSFSYTGGSGVDTLVINGPNGFALTANLGAGADLFKYLTLGTTVGSAVIDFGVDFDVDMYMFPVGFSVTWNQTLKNLP